MLAFGASLEMIATFGQILISVVDNALIPNSKPVEKALRSA
jgi:hypothetical protein